MITITEQYIKDYKDKLDKIAKSFDLDKQKIIVEELTIKVSAPDKSLTDIYHKEQPDENKNKPTGKLRVRVCELCDKDGIPYKDDTLTDMLNRTYRLYNVNWSNTTGEIKDDNYVGLEAKGLEDIYVICYDDIYKKQYDPIDNEWVYNENETKKHHIEKAPCQPPQRRNTFC